MNDYKELIEHLRKFGLRLYGEKTSILQTAADAIEQLAKDIEVLTRERDAAVENIPKSCSKCAHSQDGYARVLADGKTDGFCLTCVSNRRCNFKWRGVQG